MDDQLKHGIGDDAGGIASHIETEIDDLDLRHPAPARQDADEKIEAKCAAADGGAGVVAPDIPAPVQQDFDRAFEKAKWAAAAGGALVDALDELREAEDWLRYEIVGQAFEGMLDARLGGIRCLHRRERTRDDVLRAVFNPESHAHVGFIENFDESFERYKSSARRAESRRSHALVYERSLDKDQRLRVDRAPPASSLIGNFTDWRNVGRLVDLLYLEKCIGMLPELEGRIVVARLMGVEVRDIAVQVGRPRCFVYAALADFRRSFR